MPEEIFTKSATKKTAVQKNTLDPIFLHDAFEFELSLETCKLEGSMIHFCVFDHDFLSGNDLEGEAFLPLNILNGVVMENTL